MLFTGSIRTCDRKGGNISSSSDTSSEHVLDMIDAVIKKLKVCGIDPLLPRLHEMPQADLQLRPVKRQSRPLPADCLDHMPVL